MRGWPHKGPFLLARSLGPRLSDLGCIWVGIPVSNSGGVQQIGTPAVINSPRAAPPAAGSLEIGSIEEKDDKEHDSWRKHHLMASSAFRAVPSQLASTLLQHQ